MPFLSKTSGISGKKPLFSCILGNTVVSTAPGLSGAGPEPELTLMTPILDAELVMQGEITSAPVKPNTPTGCPTPAVITRAMMDLTGITPLFINAGLRHPPTIPCIDARGNVGEDPRICDAVPKAHDLYRQGEMIGRFLSSYTDLLVVGECVPGGTTTALCVLRALGYDAAVSSSFITNPQSLKEAVCEQVLARIRAARVKEPLDIVRLAGDPMMPVAAGIAHAYQGQIVLAGGTQMLAVCAVIRAMGDPVPSVVTTVYVRDDPTANVVTVAHEIGTTVYYIDPSFGTLGHAGLARYCTGEVKEGTGAGGAMFLAYLMGFSEREIQRKIFDTVTGFS